MNCQYRHELRSLAFQRGELPISRGRLRRLIVLSIDEQRVHAGTFLAPDVRTRPRATLMRSQATTKQPCDEKSRTFSFDQRYLERPLVVPGALVQ